MPKAETNDEELIYKLYYRFMSMEAVKAKFLVPMKLEENFPQSNKTEKIVLKSGAKFSIAVMKGKYDREAVIMYTDWKRLRECYNGWSGSIMTLSNIINNNDAVINPTNHPRSDFISAKKCMRKWLHTQINSNLIQSGWQSDCIFIIQAKMLLSYLNCTFPLISNLLTTARLI